MGQEKFSLYKYEVFDCKKKKTNYSSFSDIYEVMLRTYFDYVYGTLLKSEGYYEILGNDSIYQQATGLYKKRSEEEWFTVDGIYFLDLEAGTYKLVLQNWGKGSYLATDNDYGENEIYIGQFRFRMVEK